MADVSFDGLTVTLEEVQDNPAKYARELERAKKSPGYAVCRCKSGPGGTPLRLVIRRYGALFHLARWPEEGYLHDPATCPFHALPTNDQHEGEESFEAICQTPDGLNVRLDTSLSVRTVGVVIDRERREIAPNTVSRRSAPLLGFLQRIWIEARLHEWTGAARSWGTCNAQIVAALGVGKLNGKSMQDVLYVMRRYEPTEKAAIAAEFDAFLSRIKTSEGTSERGLLIAELNAVEPSKYGFVIKVRQTHHSFFASKAVIDQVTASFRSAWTLIGVPHARVVALLVLERTKDGNLRVIDIALQLCNSSFIPCDSSYEVAMANRLVAERRRFKKPMRLVPGDDTLPDFQLTDTATPTVIEVYGMHDNAQYLARKTQKQALYARAATPCVEWIPPADVRSVRLLVAAT
ncbi:DUF1173 family protein [Candidatus Burkholderia verschuerenii]|uniref:DUF1173 family protein n=1 Tax=Candidatus Burkholderia verschuerenii TaxID=242163 RepID=UPI00067C943B|nr:DUF1173 family protein [Candidatus Burkholderia verschuerenii]